PILHRVREREHNPRTRCKIRRKSGPSTTDFQSSTRIGVLARELDAKSGAAWIPAACSLLGTA
ncbi:MAG: hypothetical protein LBR44_08630, partial [Clostridiales Family XIII bacterium]|nr:hypothetical protein [Clostridiales Family XIII bacterium]